MRYLLCALLSLTATASFGQQVKQFNGTWTKINTTYEFDFILTLRIDKANQVEGHFDWKVVKYDEHNNSSKQYYENKIGMTAKEFVRGRYDTTNNELNLKGYKKEDPNNIIGLDIYTLKIDENGNIGGTTNALGTWLGRIHGKPVVMEVL